MSEAAVNHPGMKHSSHRLAKEIAAERERQYTELRQDVERARLDMQTAMINFRNVSEPHIVDMYIYEIQEAQTKYDYLLKQLKDL